MKELVLQPQSEIPMFRKFLRKKGFITCRENMIFEDGKFYPVMRVIPGSTETQDVSPDRELEDRYGGILLRERHPVLEKYLYMEKENLEELGAGWNPRGYGPKRTGGAPKKSGGSFR